MKQKNSAFTLIELLVVILIIALLIMVAAPSFQGQQTKAQDSKTKQNLAVVHKELKAIWTNEGQSDFPALGTETSINDKSIIAELKNSEPQLTFKPYSTTDYTANNNVSTDDQTVSVSKDNNTSVSACLKSASQIFYCVALSAQGGFAESFSNVSQAANDSTTFYSAGENEKAARCLVRKSLGLETTCSESLGQAANTWSSGSIVPPSSGAAVNNSFCSNLSENNYSNAIIASAKNYWKFDQYGCSSYNNSILGGSPFATQGTIVENQTGATAQTGKSIKINDLNASATATISNMNNSPNTAVEFWIKVNNWPNYSNYIYGRTFKLTSPEATLVMYLNGGLAGGASNMAFVRKGNVGDNGLACNHSYMSLNQWHHVVINQIPSNIDREIEIYIDGVNISPNCSKPWNNNNTESVLNVSSLSIANETSNNGAIFEIDDLSVYNKSLLSSEVTNHYNLGK